MEPQFPPSAHQPPRRYYSSRREMMNRASFRQILEQPAPASQARAMPLDPGVQVLLEIEPWPSSRTWTPATETPDFLEEDDQDEVQAAFMEEYNSLAEQNGVQLLVVGGTTLNNLETPEPQQPGLLHRIFSGPSRPDLSSRGLNRRSVSDLTYFRRYKPDVYTPIDLAKMERLTSKSVLRLPPDYAPFPLVIPTCLRACAQFIAENANTRGIFRVSGSERVIEEFSRYYDSLPAEEVAVLGTVRQDTLPVHIAHTIHDVASTFKRFLSRLPGGVLASQTLFNAFVAIHEQLDGPSDLSSAHHAKIRARLIALAIESIKSKCLRHVICAVFGLLHMIGRITELSPEESVDGRPLHPDHQFVDYKGLGVCIGPLLTNDPPLKPGQLIPGPLPFSWSSKLLRRKTKNAADDAKVRETKIREAIVKRAMIAADVAEMLITHWRDVVYELKGLNKNARDGVAILHLEYSKMPPLSSDPDIGNLLVDSDVSSEAESGESSQETLFLTTTATANGQRAVRSGLETTSNSSRLTRSGAIRRPTGRTSRTSSRSSSEATVLPAENASDGLTQSMSMDAIPARGSSRYTVHFGVSEMAPTDETESTKMENSQRPLADRSLVIVRDRPVEEPDREIIRPPLPARLRKKGKGIKDSLLTHASELFDCGMQQPRSSFDDSSLLPLERHATMRRPYRPLPPRFPNAETAGDDHLSTTDLQPRYLVDFARNRVPIVFEQKNIESTASKSTSRAPQMDDTEHLSGSNSSKQRGAFTDVCEKGTQTNTTGDEVTSWLVSDFTQHGCVDHSAVTESELVSRPDGSSTKAENGSMMWDEKESAGAILLEAEIQQLKEYDLPALRQQLQDANGDLNRWKERALAAEKKARLFQRFTTRVRHLYGSLLTEPSTQSGDNGSAVKEESDAEGSYLIHSVRFKKALEAIERGAQPSGDRERIFHSLYPWIHIRGGSPSGGSPSGGAKTTATGDGLLLQSMDGVASPRDDEETLKLRLGMVELWMTVQELLRMEDEEASSSSPSSSSSSSLAFQQSSTSTKNERSSTDAFF